MAYSRDELIHHFDMIVNLLLKSPPYNKNEKHRNFILDKLLLNPTQPLPKDDEKAYSSLQILLRNPNPTIQRLTHNAITFARYFSDLKKNDKLLNTIRNILSSSSPSLTLTYTPSLKKYFIKEGTLPVSIDSSDLLAFSEKEMSILLNLLSVASIGTVLLPRQLSLEKFGDLRNKMQPILSNANIHEVGVNEVIYWSELKSFLKQSKCRQFIFPFQSFEYPHTEFDDFLEIVGKVKGLDLPHNPKKEPNKFNTLMYYLSNQKYDFQDFITMLEQNHNLTYLNLSGQDFSLLDDVEFKLFSTMLADSNISIVNLANTKLTLERLDALYLALYTNFNLYDIGFVPEHLDLQKILNRNAYIANAVNSAKVAINDPGNTVLYENSIKHINQALSELKEFDTESANRCRTSLEEKKDELLWKRAGWMLDICKNPSKVILKASKEKRNELAANENQYIKSDKQEIDESMPSKSQITIDSSELINKHVAATIEKHIKSTIELLVSFPITSNYYQQSHFEAFQILYHYSRDNGSQSREAFINALPCLLNEENKFISFSDKTDCQKVINGFLLQAAGVINLEKLNMSDEEQVALLQYIVLKQVFEQVISPKDKAKFSLFSDREAALINRHLKIFDQIDMSNFSIATCKEIDNLWREMKHGGFKLKTMADVKGSIDNLDIFIEAIDVKKNSIKDSPVVKQSHTKGIGST